MKHQFLVVENLSFDKHPCYWFWPWKLAVLGYFLSLHSFSPVQNQHMECQFIHFLKMIGTHYYFQCAIQIFFLVKRKYQCSIYVEGNVLFFFFFFGPTEIKGNVISTKSVCFVLNYQFLGQLIHFFQSADKTSNQESSVQFSFPISLRHNVDKPFEISFWVIVF